MCEAVSTCLYLFIIQDILLSPDVNELHHNRPNSPQSRRKKKNKKAQRCLVVLLSALWSRDTLTVHHRLDGCAVIVRVCVDTSVHVVL